MELEEFITKSLLDIRNGVRAANEEIAKIEGGILGKDKTAHFQMGPYSDGSGQVTFDVAVTAESSGGGEAKAGIHVLGLGLGFASKIGFHSKNERVSRITFHVKPGYHTG